ncbi:MAG TPA: hypothetical protein VKB75_09605 [Jatrophihabitans sp.]|nr:hypothetical protein [Jatrophihabitans sp.]
MTTCPQCGRVGDGEIVCAQCGKFLAPLIDKQPIEDDDGQSGLSGLGFASHAAPGTMDVRTWRVLAFAVGTCLLLALGAFLLLHQPTGPTSKVAQPLATAGSTSPFATLPTGLASASATSATRSSHPARPSTSRVHPHTTAHSASPTLITTTRATAKPSTPTPSHIRHVTPSVAAAKGSPGFLCGPHCFYVDVTLSGFPAGTHSISCYSDQRGQFASYVTSSRTSAVCEYSKNNDTVWVIVDGRYKSNTVQW